MEFIILFVVLVIGLITGWNLRERYAMLVVKDLVSELSTKAKENSIKIKMEKHNDHFYVYNAEDNSFMGQSDTFDNIDKLLSERYPGKKFLMTEENMKEVGIEL